MLFDDARSERRVSLDWLLTRCTPSPPPPPISIRHSLPDLEQPPFQFPIHAIRESQIHCTINLDPSPAPASVQLHDPRRLGGSATNGSHYPCNLHLHLQSPKPRTTLPVSQYEPFVAYHYLPSSTIKEGVSNCLTRRTALLPPYPASTAAPKASITQQS